MVTNNEADKILFIIVMEIWDVNQNLDSWSNESFDNQINEIDKEQLLLFKSLESIEEMVEREQIEIDRLHGNSSEIQQEIDNRKHKIKAYKLRIETIWNTMIEMKSTITRLKVQKYSGMKNKYTKHESNAKYLFEIPTHEYLQCLTGSEFKDYEKYQKILTKYPQINITSENKKMETTEEVKYLGYYWTKYDKDRPDICYGFTIYKEGGFIQGVLKNFKILSIQAIVLNKRKTEP